MKLQNSHFPTYATRFAGGICFVLFLLAFMIPIGISGSCSFTHDRSVTNGSPENKKAAKDAGVEIRSAIYIADSTEVSGMENFSQDTTNRPGVMKVTAKHTIARNKAEALKKGKKKDHRVPDAYRPVLKTGSIFFSTPALHNAEGLVVTNDPTCLQLLNENIYIIHHHTEEKSKLSFNEKYCMRFGIFTLLYSRPPPMPLSVG